jgi:hypothetical protein
MGKLRFVTFANVRTVSLHVLACNLKRGIAILGIT